MTYIITHRTEELILMASDTRLSYHYDKIINGEKCQEIVAIADCIQKTFFINKAKIGIQFLGIGYFADGIERYPLSHFLDKIEELQFVKDFKVDCRKIYDFLKIISIEGDTGNYVKGIMAGFAKKKSIACTFNTYNNEFSLKELNDGDFIDSEGNRIPISSNTDIAKREIIERIKEKSKVKWWNIGDQVEMLAITEKSANFISKSSSIFNDSMPSLIEKLKLFPESINGRIISPPHIEKYDL